LNYPNVGEAEFIEFLGQSNAMDSNLTIHNAQIAFKAANFSVDNNNSVTTLSRYEFIEILVRCSKWKYVVAKHTEQMSEAFFLLINHFKANFTPIKF
jgi:hypothetical protein